MADGDKTRVEFAEELNPWSVFLLEDGTRIRVRLVMVKIEKIEGAKLPDGQQAYQTNFHPIIDQSEPERVAKPSGIIKD